MGCTGQLLHCRTTLQEGREAGDIREVEDKEVVEGDIRDKVEDMEVEEVREEDTRTREEREGTRITGPILRRCIRRCSREAASIRVRAVLHACVGDKGESHLTFMQ